MKKLLIVWGCTHKLHYYEFVLPIKRIATQTDWKITVKHYLEISGAPEVDKIIFAGTSLRDGHYPLEFFGWLREINKPVLGICAGMQLLCGVHDCTFFPLEEIGLSRIHFAREFLGSKGDCDVYDLHRFSVKEDKMFKSQFDVYARSSVVQAVKHKEKPLYGVLFLPEARNKIIIKHFIQKI